MFKYEMHCHTSVSSKCGMSTPAEQADFYKSLGYTGLFITDHFFNGNCTVNKHLTWEERVNEYCKAYEEAKERGDKIGLDVFFGFEFTQGGGTDFLVYGLDKEWLLAHPYCDKYSAKEICELAHRDGGFVVQAHPFREAKYIEMIRLLPRSVDAVETMNAKRTDFENNAADVYADMYGLKKFAGSDNHLTERMTQISYLEIGKKIRKVSSMIKLFKKGEYKIGLTTVEDIKKSGF